MLLGYATIWGNVLTVGDSSMSTRGSARTTSEMSSLPSVPMVWSTDQGQVHVFGRYKQILSEMAFPCEVHNFKKTTTTGVEIKLDGDLVASWDNAAGNEIYALWNLDDAWVYINTYSDYFMSVDVCAPNWERAHEVASVVYDAAPAWELPEKDTVAVDFVFWGGMEPTSRTRELKVPKWEDIERNYAPDASNALGELMKLRPDGIDSGRIMLMHGPAGTGKTTAIRALADAWRSWCNVSYVVDADEMFSRGSYLMNVLLNNTNDDKWRLVVIEDAEEFLTPDAKRNVGQSVARLLNLGDGLIGQGLNVLILMTTNAPVTKLHDAIMRPGRCIANIEVPKLSTADASKWSGSAVGKDSTLAELFEMKRSSQIGAGISAAPLPGAYI